MKSVEVRRVLIKRTVAFLQLRDMTIEDAINEGWFNPKYLVGISKKGMGLE